MRYYNENESCRDFVRHSMNYLLSMVCRRDIPLYRARFHSIIHGPAVPLKRYRTFRGAHKTPSRWEGYPLGSHETKPTIGGSWNGRDTRLIYVRPRTLHNHFELVTRGPRPRSRSEKKKPEYRVTDLTVAGRQRSYHAIFGGDNGAPRTVRIDGFYGEDRQPWE